LHHLENLAYAIPVELYLESMRLAYDNSFSSNR
jgi:hypothetical protein